MGDHSSDEDDEEIEENFNTKWRHAMDHYDAYYANRNDEISQQSVENENETEDTDKEQQQAQETENENRSDESFIQTNEQSNNMEDISKLLNLSPIEGNSNQKCLSRAPENVTMALS